MSGPNGHPDLFVTYGEDSPFAEAYRVLRTSLFQQAGGSLWALGVTGAAPQHGSSTTVANLGLVMGETQSRVVLVDADLYRPTLHLRFDLPNTCGLSSVLQGEIGVADALQTVGETSLRVLPGGPPVRNPTRLLRPAALDDLFERLRRDADLVIVDLPSVRAVAYTSVLAARVSGLLLVVRSGTVSGEQVSRLIRRRLRGVNVVGIVLNRVDPRNSEVEAYRYYARTAG